ncbi:hypothetical protein PILCRDRAFT_290182 [Piloderma croceum F 1598]|uniref:Uncharacterized protein n=1 Tax=Piloderma croceum (strain F 1598) TaxID=765440 RepID=A0A0C3BKE5_PILCF|nr:hypothetical protein PILCRDRAFT_290182 [Piloderma croceum F 1598]
MSEETRSISLLIIPQVRTLKKWTKISLCPYISLPLCCYLLTLVPLSKENPNIDPELHKYLPPVKFSLKVVMSTTSLVTTNITAAAAYLAEIPQTLKSIESISLERTSFRYSFFSDEDAKPCVSPIAACPACFHVLP